MNILPGKRHFASRNFSQFEFHLTLMHRIAEDVYIKIEDTKGSLTCKEKKKVKKRGKGSCQNQPSLCFVRCLQGII